MTPSFHYEGKLGPIKLALRLHILLEPPFQARKASGHVYVCLRYQLYISLSTICPLDYGTVPTVLVCFVFHIISCLARKVHYCALYGSFYLPIDLH